MLERPSVAERGGVGDLDVVAEALEQRRGRLGGRPDLWVDLDGAVPRRGRPADAERTGVRAHLLGVGALGRGAHDGSPTPGPSTASSSAAASRTERVTARRATRPAHASPSGAMVERPRLGLSPTSPHSEAGIRIDPPPSPAWATGTTPAATSAAEPPLEPPVERSVSHGLRVGPCDSGSVVVTRPSSGVLDLPMTTKPAWRNRTVSSLSTGDT
ncbi:MAG: hypothetical protein R2711_06790 [Acidimicrobiales bacterium]